MKALWLALALVGCGGAPVRVSLEPPAKPPTAKEYVDELKRWTRHGHIISDFDETLTVDATLHAPEFREAFAEKWIDVYRMNESDAAAARAKMKADIADVWELHAETSTHIYDVNEFNTTKSPWRVTLVDDRNRSISTTDIKLDRSRREVTLVLYPYATLFSRSWKMRFPRNLPDGSPLITADTKSLVLRIAGPAGSVDLVWDLQR
jgi:hypothetical protein